MIISTHFKDYISQATHHKVELKVVAGDIIQALEADRYLIPSVVQVAQVDYDDLLTLLHGGGNGGSIDKQTISVIAPIHFGLHLNA